MNKVYRILFLSCAFVTLLKAGTGTVTLKFDKDIFIEPKIAGKYPLPGYTLTSTSPHMSPQSITSFYILKPACVKRAVKEVNLYRRYLINWIFTGELKTNKVYLLSLEKLFASSNILELEGLMFSIVPGPVGYLIKNGDFFPYHPQFVTIEDFKDKSIEVQ